MSGLENVAISQKEGTLHASRESGCTVGHFRLNSFQLKTALENSRDVWRLRGGVGARFEYPTGLIFRSFHACLFDAFWRNVLKISL